MTNWSDLLPPEFGGNLYPSSHSRKEWVLGVVLLLVAIRVQIPLRELVSASRKVYQVQFLTQSHTPKRINWRCEMKKIKDWAIKKLGGITAEQLHDYKADIADFVKNESSDNVLVIDGDYTSIDSALFDGKKLYIPVGTRYVSISNCSFTGQAASLL